MSPMLAPHTKQSLFNVWFSADDEDYVFNTKTSAMFQMDPAYLSHVSEDEACTLMSSGILVDEKKDEVSILEHEVMEGLNVPIGEVYLTIVLTERCNFHCVYCYQEHGGESLTPRDSHELLKHAERIVQRGATALRIVYFGGEPLLNREAILQIDAGVKAISREYGVEYSALISTNGSLLDDELLERVSFERIRLTFDGDETWHNSLKRAHSFPYREQVSLLDRIVRTTASNLEIRLNLCRENADSFVETLNDISTMISANIRRIRLVYAALHNEVHSPTFHELTSEHFAHKVLLLRLHARNLGFTQCLPGMSRPCPFRTGRALCIGPGLRRRICSKRIEFFDEANGVTSYQDIAFHGTCRSCSVLPLCMGPCPMSPEKHACIPERYILRDLLRDFVCHREGWVIEQEHE